MKAWTAGTIYGGYYLCKDRGFFFIKKPERGGRTAGSILPEFKDFFAKCQDLPVRPADRTAEDSQRCGHAGCPPFGAVNNMSRYITKWMNQKSQSDL